MSQFHRHSAWGRVRRPKNILGEDGTRVTSAATSDTTIIDSAAPDNDKRETISGVALNAATRRITLTTADSLGTNVFDGASGVVITRGFHQLVDGKPLNIISTNDAANETVVTVPGDISQHVLNSLTLSARGTLVQQTVDGVRTENARYLHLWLYDSTGGGVTITVYGYNYAFGEWGVIQLPVGVQNGAHTTAELAYVDAIFTAANTARTHILPIAGIDKVYFVSSEANDADVKLSAAISTF